MYDYNATKTGRRGIHRGQTFLFTRKGFKCEKNKTKQLRYSKEKNQSKIGERGIKSAFSSARV